jgi:ABC-type branched-subunit amino acid transport system substrate-binding protein
LRFHQLFEVKKGESEMNKRKLIGLGLILMIVLAACQPSTNNQTSKEPIKIGFVGDFSGFWSLSEKPARDGALFAVEEINKAGGVLGRQLMLDARDGQNDNALTVRLLEEMINDGIVYIIGTVGDPIVAEGNIACKSE